jgi:hypothetical protein
MSILTAVPATRAAHRLHMRCSPAPAKNAWRSDSLASISIVLAFSVTTSLRRAACQVDAFLCEEMGSLNEPRPARISE